MMKLENAINDYVSLKAPRTEIAYRSALTVLASYLKVERNSHNFARKMRALTVGQATEFMTWLRCRIAPDGQKMADATVHQRLALLRRLYRHLAALELVTFNPFDAIADVVPRRQRRQKRPTKFIQFDKVIELLEAPAKNTKDGIRDRAIMALLFGGGLRRSEVAEHNVGDFETTPQGVPYLVIRGAKAGQNQQQALPEWAWETYSTLILQRKSEGATENDPLIVFYYIDGTPRERLSTETIRRIYMRYCKQTGIGHAAPHSARATAVTFLKALGYSDEDVQSFVRHAGPGMIRAYNKLVKGPETCISRFIDYKKPPKIGGKVLPLQVESKFGRFQGNRRIAR